MKPRTDKPNPWQLLNRARKVARITLAIEEWAPANGIAADDVPGAVSRWDDAMWRRIAVAAGQNPPSEAAKLDVLAMLRERTRAA